jgi:hypothetical protein
MSLSSSEGDPHAGQAADEGRVRVGVEVGADRLGDQSFGVASADPGAEQVLGEPAPPGTTDLFRGGVAVGGW